MKKLSSILFLLFAISMIAHAQNSGMIVNLNDAKKAVKDYYTSGRYDREIEKNIDEALINLSQIELSKNSAFIFDIDETALSNWFHEISYDFGYIKKYWDEWVDSAKAPAIPQVKRFYDSLVAKKINILFITGRNQMQYKQTYNNLIKVGYTQIDTLICKSVDFTGKKAIDYKSLKRKELSAKYKIIGSIGDQWSDLDGGWTILKVKIPNYMYFIE
jgi:acid phosphatase